MTYGLSNRLYAKKESAREIVTVSLSQTYYSVATASTVDQQYQSSYNNALPPSREGAADATIYLVLFITISGIYLWWTLKAERRIGAVLLSAGIMTFLGLIYVVIR